MKGGRCLSAAARFSYAGAYLHTFLLA